MLTTSIRLPTPTAKWQQVRFREIKLQYLQSRNRLVAALAQQGARSSKGVQDNSEA